MPIVRAVAPVTFQAPVTSLRAHVETDRHPARLQIVDTIAGAVDRHAMARYLRP